MPEGLRLEGLEDCSLTTLKGSEVDALRILTPGGDHRELFTDHFKVVTIHLKIFSGRETWHRRTSDTDHFKMASDRGT